MDELELGHRAFAERVGRDELRRFDQRVGEALCEHALAELRTLHGELQQRLSALVAAMLARDEEGDQAGQRHAVEEVFALDGGKDPSGVLARCDLAAEAIAPADERADAAVREQRVAHAPGRHSAVLGAPRGSLHSRPNGGFAAMR